VTTTIIATVIVLGVLIFVHELGHFLAAKRSKVGVLTFLWDLAPSCSEKRSGKLCIRFPWSPWEAM